MPKKKKTKQHTLQDFPVPLEHNGNRIVAYDRLKPFSEENMKHIATLGDYLLNEDGTPNEQGRLFIRLVEMSPYMYLFMNELALTGQSNTAYDFVKFIDGDWEE